MPRTVLLTGPTRGLGLALLHHLLHTHAYPPSSIIATSRTPSSASTFTSQGLLFRHLDYSAPETLLPALQGVHTFFMIASPEPDTPKRIEQHKAVIDAAVQAGVQKVYYNSLAFGGFEDNSDVSFQAAHYVTEEYLAASGLDFVSLRAGVYTDAFPIFLGWYPQSTNVIWPRLAPAGVGDGRVAFTSREELGEACAALLAHGLEGFPAIAPRGPSRIVLLTARKTYTHIELLDAVRRATGRPIPIDYKTPEEYISESARDDIGKKPEGVFGVILGYLRGVNAGDAETVDDAMAALLGREPEGGVEGVERLIREAGEGGYTWHQNHFA